MRLATAAIATVFAAATCHIAIASVFARGEAVVAIAGGEGEPAVEWDIEVAGGTPSTDHITLSPIAIGLEGEFTVAVAGSRATVRLTTVLPGEGELASVGCLDDLFPPTEINPVIDGSSFTFEVAPGRRYRCFAASSPTGIADPVAPPAGPSQSALAPLLPRSDSSVTPGASPGWPAVLITLVVILGVALMLRPARR
jgi:hypothetical protein